ncbi:hypothetical protein QAD02_000644 [Eretmocerus hayati]|uniref:Uncharacterized protein n=1 Tax=Eretmocerus hayati TaxID=131215 RepID=A0ACC2NDX4_9HYME|nr:hypothetical protein QAD02_000644 [Eretmocerus hayati]
MSSDKKNCVVPGCSSNRSVKRFEFPRNPTIGKIWLELIGNDSLDGSDYESIKKRNGKNILKKGVHPTLRLRPENVVPEVTQQVEAPSVLDPGISAQPPVDCPVPIIIDDVKCLCGEPVKELPSHKHGGRKFYKCQNMVVDGDCGFFMWVPGSSQTGNSQTEIDLEKSTPDDTVKCRCGEPAEGHIPESHLGQKFYRCRDVSGEGNCNFFVWASDIHTLPSLQSGIQSDPDMQPLITPKNSRKRLRQEESGLSFEMAKRPRTQDSLQALDQDQTFDDSEVENSTPVSTPRAPIKLFRRGFSNEKADETLDMQARQIRNLKRRKIKLEKLLESKNDPLAERFSKCYPTMNDAQKLWMDMMLIPKWTPAHVLKEKLKKMQVKICTETYSPVQTSFGKKEMPANSLIVGEHMLFMDKFIDSLNGPGPNDVAKEYRVPVTENSFHHEFWGEAKKEPTLKNGIKTIDDFRLLWKKFQRLGLKQMNQRNNNQDVVECSNAEYRAHVGDNDNPPADQIDGIFKTLLITSMTSKKSILGGNCSSDPGKRLLTWAKSIVQPDVPRSLGFRFIRQEHGFSHKTVVFMSMANMLKGARSSKLFKECNICLEKEEALTDEIIARRNQIHSDVKEMVVDGLPCVYVERDFIKEQTVIKKKTHTDRHFEILHVISSSRRVDFFSLQHV